MPKNQSKTKSKKSEPLPEKTGKEGKLFNNLLKTTQQFIQGRSFIPASFGELFTKLHLPEQHREIFAEVLHSLVKQGVIEIVRGKYACKSTVEDTITGILRLHPRGFGFVKPEDSTAYSQDIFIPKHLTEGAIDGDTVEVVVNNEVISEKGPEGRITTILTRGRTHLAGIICEVGRKGDYYAYAPLLGLNQRVIVETSKNETLVAGDRVVMEVIEWGNKENPTFSRLSRRLGHISDPSCDVSAAIEEFEIRTEFSAKAVEEARQFGTQVSVSEIRKREDMRPLTCITIDPDTAKDFDDAISLKKDSNGHYHLGVHIADVSHYVSPGSHLDIEAQMRCNSTYFPGNCVPMLPRELSDNLCSLKPNVNRLTASVMMEFDQNGTLVNHRMVRSVIKSAKRFTYKEAKAVLDGKKKSVHLELLQLMVELCGLLKKKRYERGSIEFGMPELVVLVNDKGVPTGTDYVVYDITHQLVEEFMLKANETVAWHLTKEGKFLTYRVHDVPAEENMKDFSLLAGAFGFTLSPIPTPREIQKLFDEAMQTPYGEYLATSYIRRMRLASYSSDNIGHYGLSLEFYCHFTSPIRRYVDLVAHRILFHQIAGKEELEMIAARSSEQERISAKAENSVTMLKKLRLLDAQTKETPFREYEAVVTRVKNFGFYFEVLDLMLESYLHVSELDNDYYVYEEAEMILRGRHRNQVFRAGDKVTVMLKEVNLITLDSKWNLIPDTKRSQTSREPGDNRRVQKKDKRAHKRVDKCARSSKSKKGPLKQKSSSSKKRKK